MSYRYARKHATEAGMIAHIRSIFPLGVNFTVIKTDDNFFTAIFPFPLNRRYSRQEIGHHGYYTVNL